MANRLLAIPRMLLAGRMDGALMGNGMRQVLAPAAPKDKKPAPAGK